MNLGRRLPAASCGLPGNGAGLPMFPYLALLHVGFTELPASPPALVGSYPTVPPLPPKRPQAVAFAGGGIVSVALAWGYPHWVLPSTRPVESRLSSTGSAEAPGSGSPASWIGMSLYSTVGCLAVVADCRR